MTFYKTTIDAVRILAKTMTAKEIQKELKMSASTFYRLLHQNRDIKVQSAKRGRPTKF